MNLPKLAFSLLLSAFCFLHALAQSNRLTTENGELLWQYSQHIEIDENAPKTVYVTFVFINGINQTAISLRQERFFSQIEWTETANYQIEKEERVEFITANLAPSDSIVLKYTLHQPKVKNNELIAEKSAILIMNDEFEVRKEFIPEQKFAIEKK
jgi:hypothetical protein